MLTALHEINMKQQSNIIVGPPCPTVLPSNLSLSQLLFDQLKSHGKRVAQIHWDTGEETRYDEIFEKSRKLALYLTKQGVREGDRIAICSENNSRFCIPMCAGILIGVSICPLNPLYSEKELQHALGISQPKFFFASPLVVGLIQDVVENLPWSPKLILLADSPDSNLPSIDSVISSISMSMMIRFRPKKADVKQNVVCIMCSSGTTGLPKGVQLTDSNILSTIQVLADPSTGFTTNAQISLGLLPFFHAYAFVSLIVRLTVGSTVVILSRFDENSFLGAIEKYKIQNLQLVPPLMVFLAKHPLVDRYDLSSIEAIWCGAAPLSKQVQEAVKKRLKLENINQGYGLTETTLAVLKSPIGSSKPGSVGVVVPGISAKVVPIGSETSGEALGPNCEGELCFKGDLIMKGYCGDVSATATMIDNEGWLHTGDVGYYDDDRFFFIVDRVKELIKYKGYQVPPAELEAILLTHPAIKDAAVIGMPDEEAGELPMAFVVKQPGEQITAEDIIKFVNERVSIQKRLRGGVRFMDDIPKTPSGKILRRELRNMLKSKI